MSDLRPSSSGSPAFAAAVAALRAARPRREIELEEVPAPTRLAPEAFAVTADVAVPGAAVDDAATGRLVLLHDPSVPDPWGSAWRVVTFARAAMEHVLADDPLLSEIGWTWLREALDRREADVTALAGTVTRVVNERFGDLAGEPPAVELEVRASWSLLGAPEDAGDHLLAWADLVAALAGLPPVPEGVSHLPGARW